MSRQVIVFLVFMAGLLPVRNANAQAGNVITVRANEPKANIKPTMWGVFFEDINFGADGGLYAELVKNRSFEFPDGLMGWSVPAENADTTSVKVQVDEAAKTPNRHFLAVESRGVGAV